MDAINQSATSQQKNQEKMANSMQRLLNIMEALRDPKTGCPWDVEQDFASIAAYTIEEAYEVADVIERQSWPELAGELGDLLLQVVFHARMAEEKEWFDFTDVVDSIADKMVRRHPHVFAGASVADAEEQTKIWEAQKKAERAEKGQQSTLDDIPVSLSEPMRAMKLQKRAANVGFDWPDAKSVDEKLVEELEELTVARESGIKKDIEDELGDVFFVLTNLGRKLGIDSATAMRHANNKFERRFRAMEQLAIQQGQHLEELTLDQQEALWQMVKEQEVG